MQRTSRKAETRAANYCLRLSVQASPDNWDGKGTGLGEGRGGLRIWRREQRETKNLGSPGNPTQATWRRRGRRGGSSLTHTCRTGHTSAWPRFSEENVMQSWASFPRLGSCGLVLRRTVPKCGDSEEQIYERPLEAALVPLNEETKGPEVICCWLR